MNQDFRSDIKGKDSDNFMGEKGGLNLLANPMGPMLRAHIRENESWRGKPFFTTQTPRVKRYTKWK